MLRKLSNQESANLHQGWLVFFLRSDYSALLRAIEEHFFIKYYPVNMVHHTFLHFREHVGVYIRPRHVYVIVMRIGLVHVDNPRLEGSGFDF